MFNRIFSARIFAAVLFFIPCVLQAAGLGKLTVHSGLGQPLRAEIELLSVTKEEAGSLAAKLASPEAFQQAGIPYSTELGAIKLAVENNSRGQPVIKLTSSQPFNEPFLDLLVELNWSSGRLLREYTALLDPPDVGIPLSPPVAVAPEAIAETKAPPPVAVAPEAIAETKAPPPAAEPAAPAATTATTADGDYGPVKSGDTLSKIALGVKPSDVNLEQALVSLYRANQEAFSGNMHRLKTGHVLRVPDSVEFAAVTKSEASAEVKAQTADWNAYRQKLGIAPVGVADSGSQRSSSGKISVADSGETAAESGDVLKISKAETAFTPAAQASGALQERVKTLEEEVVAKERAVQEANERVAILEKQVSEMKRLVELQGQTPAPVESKPEVPAEPKAESAPAQPVQPEKPVAVPAPKPPVEPVSFLDQVMENPLYLAAFGLIIVLAGLFGIKALRRKQSAAAVVAEEPVIVPVDEPQVQPAAVETDTVVTAASAEEMDPLAEAEVYLAYDRETQAEEILKEGLRKTPARHELHMKLLEIYSRRRDFTSFDVTAQQLYNSTGGMGPTWERAAAMGYQFNPSNPLYGRAEQAEVRPVREASDETFFASPDEPTATVPEFEFDIGREEKPRTALASESDFKLDETLIFRNEEVASPAEEPELTPEKLIATIDFNVERKQQKSSEAESRFEMPAEAEEEKPVGDFMRQREEPALSFDAPETKNGNGQAGDFSFHPEPQPAFSDIDLLNLEDQPSPGDGDELWQQVETKFDLARAYQEMGEKEGAREILEEVLKDGDAKQQRAARSMLASL